MLIIAAMLAIAIGLVHSFLGEKYILMRLFRRPLPKLFGDDWLTKRTLRFAWHLLTVAWFGFAAILVLLYLGMASQSNLLIAIATSFAITAVVAFAASRGRHLSWVVFGAISAICYLAL